MKSINSVERLLIKVTDGRKVSRKQLMTSYISLFLAVSILSVATFSWFTAVDKTTIDTSAVTVTNSSGLRVNNGEDISSNIILSKEVKLAEASSVDGRNMYFPTTGTFSDTTSEMIFREGNVGDKNTKYYYNNFTLDVDSDNTEVYVKSYSVKVTRTDGTFELFDGSVKLNDDEGSKKHEECPVRIAFIQDSSETPVVIDPTALISNYAKTYNAVSSTDANGVPVTGSSESHSFSDYYFATDNPLFTLNADDVLDTTMVIWLEGTGGNCNDYAGGTIEVNIQLESNWDYMDQIKFIDKTKGDSGDAYNTEIHWIASDDCVVIMSYYDTKTKKNKAVVMSKSDNYSNDYTWTAALPEYIVTDIKFMRYNPAAEEIWNIWYTEEDINDRVSDATKQTPEYQTKILEESRIITENDVKYRCLTYEAIRGNGNGDTDDQYQREQPGLGYWTDGVKLEGDEEEPTTPQVTQPDDTTAPDWYLRGDMNSWATDDSNYHFSKTTTNKYKLTTQLSAGTYEIKLYDKNSEKWYRTSESSITDTVSSSTISVADGNMNFTATGGTYTFVIDTSDASNYKLTISKETVSTGDKTVTIILQDNKNSSTQNYYLVLSDGNEIKMNLLSNETTRYQNSVTLSEGVSTSSFVIKSGDTVTASYDATHLGMNDGWNYTYTITSSGGSW